MSMLFIPPDFQHGDCVNLVVLWVILKPVVAKTTLSTPQASIFSNNTLCLELPTLLEDFSQCVFSAEFSVQPLHSFPEQIYLLQEFLLYSFRIFLPQCLFMWWGWWREEGCSLMFWLIPRQSQVSQT